MKSIFYILLFIPFVSLAQPSVVYEGTLMDSTGAPLTDSNIDISLAIKAPNDSCILLEKTYNIDTSNSNGHFSVDMAVGGSVVYDDTGTNTLAAVMSNSAGPALNCKTASQFTPTGSFQLRKVQLSLTAVGGVDIADVSLPSQNLDMSPFANEAQIAVSVGDNAIDADALANNAVDSGALQNGSVTDAKITGLDGSKVSGTVAASNLENGTFMIDSAGSVGQVWTSDGSGAGGWGAAGAGDLIAANNLSDVGNVATARGNLSAQEANTHLDDLADGTLTGSKVGTGISGTNITTGTVAEARVENGTFMIDSAGSNGDVWTSDGAGKGGWTTVGGGDLLASNNLSDVGNATTARGNLSAQESNTHLDDLADGTLTGSKVGTGINGSNITSGTVAFARLTGVQASNTHLDDLADGTLTGSKVGTGINGSNITSGTVAFARLTGVQASDAQLDDIAGLTPTANNFIMGDGSNFGLADAATTRTTIGAQAADGDLDDLADGSLTGSKVGTGINGSNITTGTVAEARVENGTFMIDSAGSNGDVWTSDGAGKGGWTTIGGGDLLASNNLSDVGNAATARGNLSAQEANTHLDDLADGTLTGSKVGTGISGTNITSGTVAFARLTGVQASNTHLDDLADGTLSGSKVGTGISGSNVTTGTVAFARLAGVQASDTDLDDLADGSLSGSKVGTGIAAGNITTGNLDRPIVQTGSSNAAVGQLYNNSGPGADNGDATIDFANKNVMTTSIDCDAEGGTVTLQNMASGGAYSLILTATQNGTCAFALSGTSAVYPDGGSNVDLSGASKAVVTFLVTGSELYISSVNF